MMLKLTTASYLAAALFMLSCGSVLCYSRNDPAVPVIQAAPMSVAPTIDGKVQPGEWKDTAASNAIHEMGTIAIIPSAPTFYIGYDQSYLYIAAEVPVPPGVKLKAQRLAHDGPIWADDSIEIFIDPTFNQKDSYQFLANSVGSRTELKNQDMEWNGEWQAVAFQGEKSWSIEIRIPFKTLGVDSPAAGTVMGFNIGFDVGSPFGHVITWAPLSAVGFHQPDKFGHLVLGAAGEAVSAVSYVDEKVLGFDINSGIGISSVLKVSNDGALIGTQNLSGRGRIEFNLPIKDGKPDYADYQWGLGVTRVDSGDIVYQQSGITKVSEMLPLAISLRKYFLKGRLDVDIDVSGLKIPSQPIILIGTISDESGKKITSQQIDIALNRTATISYDVSKLPNTRHIVSIEAVDADGAVRGGNQVDFTVPPKPAWIGSKAGISDKVIAPWKPIKTRSSKGKVIVAPDGRVYTFSGSPMPDSVVTAGASILDGPVTIKLTVDGREILLKGKLEVTKNTPAQVVLRGSASAGSLKLDSVVTIDFDGNSWIDCKLYGNQAVTIDSFIIEVPVKSEHAKYRYYYPGTWGYSENARALEPAGWGAPYVPYIWIGDDDRGFAVYSTSDKNWNNKPDFNAVKISPAGANTKSICFSVITEPLKLTASQAMAGLKYTFGFEATPNKKPDKDVWDYRIVHSGYYGLEKEITSKNAFLKYTDDKNINLNRGTLDMWVRVGFDPNAKVVNYESRGIMNRDLFLVSSGSQKLGFYWNIDTRGMVVWARNGSDLTFAIDDKTDWKQNELHHLSLTWGDQICVYVDGKLLVKGDRAGLIPGVPGTTSIELTMSNSGFDIDELRISDIERKPELPNAQYTADASTLLLEHFEKLNKTHTIPAKGTPGVLSGTPQIIPGKFGNAVGTSGKPMLTLEYLKNLGVKTICFHEHWTEYENYTETINNQENLKSLVKACHEQGIQLLLYFGYLMANTCPEWDPYRREVLVMPQQGEFIREPKQKDYSVCYNSAWQDFIADGIDKLMVKYDIDGVYLDGTSWPWLCENTEHGCGYKKPDGSIVGTYSISGARDMVRRIYTIVKSHKPDGQVNIHNSTTMVMPALGWATSTWDGEQFGSIARGANLDKLFPMDTFRTEFMGRQWGPPSELLCYDTPYTTHEAFSFSLLHDVLVRGSGRWIPEESGLWKAMEKFGRKHARFMPYWSNSDMVEVTGDRCYTSLYVRAGKGVMCVVSNLGKDAGDVGVNLSLKKMKLPLNATATNAITGDVIPIKNGAFSVPLQSFDYALVWVK